MPVMAPDLKAMSSPSASELVAACAVRTLARTETFMPMKPAAPDSTAPITKPMRDLPAQEIADDDEDDDADDPDRRVLALEIGLRALAHRRGDFLHPRAAGVRRHDRLGRPDAVHDPAAPHRMMIHKAVIE